MCGAPGQVGVRVGAGGVGDARVLEGEHARVTTRRGGEAGQGQTFILGTGGNHDILQAIKPKA